jgi:hypothetical protein
MKQITTHKAIKTLSLSLLAMVFATQTSLAQDDFGGSVIQTYTPSRLLQKGQWDIKWFNNLFTQTESTFTEGREPRQTFFTSTVDVFTGISEKSSFNVGLLLEFRSNVINDRYPLEVFEFSGERGTARSGFTSISPAIKFNPIKSVDNFTIQSSLQIPLVDNETEEGVFLDQDGFIFQNRFFYDYSFPGGDWQIFTELNAEYNFGDNDDSFANDSLRLTPGIFLSYFPSSKFTVLALVQHSQLIDINNDFDQDFTSLGGGAKYQLTNALNLEFLYTNFVRGENTGLGETYNLGLRALF